MPISEIIIQRYFSFYARRFITLVLTVRTDHLPHITRAQLALRNGQDKPEVWVAFKGLVYDGRNASAAGRLGERLWRED